MEEINHLSHKEHPLKFIENTETIMGGVGGDDDDKKGIVCCWCQEPISGGSAYACITCHYFMHKTCAQLEPSINHYLHPQHPLILGPGVEGYICDVCDDQFFARAFSYRCSLCDFDACTKCGVVVVALNDVAGVMFELEGHPQHTLALQLRPAAFRCDVCKTDYKDLFYQCNDCPFWIHKTCATLAPNIHLPHHHDHSLLLAYSRPEIYHNVRYICKFCNKQIVRSHWVYHCANCKYFAHIKCVLNVYQQPITPSLSQIFNMMDQFMDNPFMSAPRGGGFGARPGWDAKEDDETLSLKFDMPGLDIDNVKISVEQNTLIIRAEAEKESEEDEEPRRRNSSRIDLPMDVYKLDEIKVEMKNGVLKIMVPKVKTEERKGARQIQVE